MAKHEIKDIRNVAFCGHGHSGKTMLTDKLLTRTGAVNRESQLASPQRSLSAARIAS